MFDYISLLHEHYFHRPVTAVKSNDREDARHSDMHVVQIFTAISYSSVVLRLISSCHKINVYVYLTLSVVFCKTVSVTNTEFITYSNIHEYIRMLAVDKVN
jgi:hypothetical protein